MQILNGAANTGALLASHPRIAKISFTGSVGGGKAVQDLATKSNLKKVTLELGGKSPAIVFDDVEIEKALGGYVYLFFYLLQGLKMDIDGHIRVCGFLFNSGQVCVGKSPTPQTLDRFSR